MAALLKLSMKKLILKTDFYCFSMIMDLYFPKSNFFRVWEIGLRKAA